MAKRKKPRKTKAKTKPPRPSPHAHSIEVQPRNRPEVIDYYLTSPDGVNWTRRQGNPIVLIAGRRPEDTDESIEELLRPFLARPEVAHIKALRDRLVDLRHKLYAVAYHLNTIDAEIARRVSEFERNYKAGAGAYQEIENPRLVYETEALLFQTKSALDLLVRALGTVVPPLSSMHSFKAANINGVEHIGGSVTRALRANGFPDLADLFEANRTRWIQATVPMRDTITHYSALRDFHCFVEEPYRGGDTVRIHYPSMPSGERVDAYCRRVYQDLLTLTAQVLNAAPEPLGPTPNPRAA